MSVGFCAQKDYDEGRAPYQEGGHQHVASPQPQPQPAPLPVSVPQPCVVPCRRRHCFGGCPLMPYQRHGDVPAVGGHCWRTCPFCVRNQSFCAQAHPHFVPCCQQQARLCWQQQQQQKRATASKEVDDDAKVEAFLKNRTVGIGVPKWACDQRGGRCSKL